MVGRGGRVFHHVAAVHLWAQGPTRRAQKVGEEGVEVALAAAIQEDERLLSESVNFSFHLSLLMGVNSLF